MPTSPAASGTHASPLHPPSHRSTHTPSHLNLTPLHPHTHPHTSPSHCSTHTHISHTLTPHPHTAPPTHTSHTLTPHPHTAPPTHTPHTPSHLTLTPLHQHTHLTHPHTSPSHRSTHTHTSHTPTPHPHTSPPTHTPHTPSHLTPSHLTLTLVSQLLQFSRAVVGGKKSGTIFYTPFPRATSARECRMACKTTLAHRYAHPHTTPPTHPHTCTPSPLTRTHLPHMHTHSTLSSVTSRNASSHCDSSPFPL